MEPLGSTLSVTWLLNKLWVILAGLFWYNKTNVDKENKKRDDLIQSLKSNTVSDEKMKEYVKEVLLPYKEDSLEIKTLLRGLDTQIASLSKDVAVQNALQNIQSPEDK